MSATTANSTTEITKEIKYNRDSKDYDCFVTVDGERMYIGSAANYSQGETKCRDYAYDYYADNHTPEKAVAVVMADELPDTEAAPIITVEQWHGEDATYADFTIGDGLTKVLIGSNGGVKDGVELIIGGSMINERLEQVITLADVRQLRDNLTALLSDARVVAALACTGTGTPPLPTPPAVQIERGGMDGACRTDFRCGEVIVEVPDAPDGETAIYNLGKDQQSIPDSTRTMHHLTTILHDPRFQAARANAA